MRPPSLWRYPLWIGVITCVGLVAALFGSGAWHVLSWIALALPLAVAAWFALRRP